MPLIRTIIPTGGHPLSPMEQEDQDEYDAEYREALERREEARLEAMLEANDRFFDQ